MRCSARLPLDALQPYLLDVPRRPWQNSRPGEGNALQDLARLDLARIFGNDHPVEAEIGFGKGTFLIAAAQARPDTNFLGIEIDRKYQLYAANRMAKRALKNVRLACDDARRFFCDLVDNGSFRAVHVYFPDPWWKTRHRKRRLFTAAFVEQCARVLRRRGTLFIATDVESYFHEMEKLLGDQTCWRHIAETESCRAVADLTNFERKYRQEGRPIYRAAYERR